MAKTIISLRDEASEMIIKEARKKAIDCNLSLSEAVVMLLDKWVKNDIKLIKKVNN